MDKSKEAIGRRIKEALKGARLNQKELSVKLNRSEPTITGYVQGRSEPSASDLATIAEVCEVSTDWLITGEGEKKRSHILTEDADQYRARVEESDLPEPIKKAVQVLMENEDMAWELYATILERAEKKKTKGQ